ncbi:DnaD domain protein [Bacillus pseudomycoides]|uniref:DnaD domain protein n=2 Tax=Bacillus pseudomycoides TaxID=64104 RepID=A0ABD6TBR5_9BACI|nr:DnaD domain protein [Bacillus pseudomycoides]MCR8859047.1 DnaD domain protein [Bacillus pseudomycoides]MED1622253.1 DnaD domain protein [Bacillus pseudomycoides]PDZ10311.1 DnaD domain protein [Bacillus pseudomycoides]PDZ74455.1 DnaD domain protein [Bacillus pseudomycoides]PEF25642.1 DnaD domain protein [Bacillus pseudomycoides]
MAVYRNVQVNFWQDDFVLDLTPEERYFYIYLLTCSKTTQCSIYPLPKRLAEMETGYNRETVEKLLQRFIDYGKILYDAETKELYIQNWVRYNLVTNTNIEKCVLRELKTVKSKKFLHMFLQKCLEEGLSIPLLLEHFGMPVEESQAVPQDDAESCETDGEIDSGGNVFTFYEQNFDSLSPHTMEELNAWMDDLSDELVLKALQIAYENNKRTLAYVKGILRDWHEKGYTRLSEVEEAAVRFRKKEPSVAHDTEKFLNDCEEWEKNVPSEEELQKFLQEHGWRP